MILDEIKIRLITIITKHNDPILLINEIEEFLNTVEVDGVMRIPKKEDIGGLLEIEKQIFHAI